MRSRWNRLLLSTVCLTCFSGGVGATVEIQILADDGNVTLNAAGSLDLTNTTNLATPGTTATSAVDPAGAFAPSVIAGPASSVEVRIECGRVDGPGAFGAGTVTWEASEGSGDTFGIYGDGESYGASGDGLCLIVPLNYQSGDNLSGSTQFANTSLSDMGLTQGTYEWSWGNGTDSLVLFIGERPAAVTIPVMSRWMRLSLCLTLVTLAFLALRKRRHCHLQPNYWRILTINKNTPLR